MRKTKEKQVKVTIKEIIKVTCNWCKKPIDLEYDLHGEITVLFGVGNTFGDYKLSADACDSCFEKHLKPHLNVIQEQSDEWFKPIK